MKLQRIVYFLPTLLLSMSCPAAGEPFTKLSFVHVGNDVWKAKTNEKEILLANQVQADGRNIHFGLLLPRLMAGTPSILAQLTPLKKRGAITSPHDSTLGMSKL